MNTATESHTIAKLERAYMRNRRRKIYLACEDMDFSWDEVQVRAVIELYKRGATVREIASDPAIDRDPDEVAVLLIDLGRNGMISREDWGSFRK